MKKFTFTITMALLGSVLFAADSAKDQVQSAAKKLAAAGNYSFKATVESPGGGRFRGGPTEGKVADGAVYLSMTRGDNTIEAVKKGEKGAIKTAEGWQSFADATEGDGGGPNRGRFLARMLQNYKTPAEQAGELAASAKSLSESDGALSGDLTEEGAKGLLTFGPRRGGNRPEPSNPKGSVKFWLKDGALAKYEFNVQGTMSFNGNDVDINRTTTVEIKDVGSTKLDLPDDAKKKL